MKRDYPVIARELLVYLNERELMDDTRIFVDNNRLSTDWSPYSRKETYKGVEFYVDDDVSPFDYFEYANPDTISLSFEGPLYDLLNYEDYDGTVLRQFLDQYDLFFELGNTWNASIAEAQ